MVLQQEAAGGRLYGTEIKRVEWPGVTGVGYSEKRALADGYDASDVFLSQRQIGLAGAVYGRTRGECWDYLQALIEALTPSAAYDDSPTDRGYLPLDFYVPTANTIDFPDGYIHKMIRARPDRQPSLVFDSDTSGGSDSEALAIPWNALLEARDPRVYFFTPTNTTISATAAEWCGQL